LTDARPLCPESRRPRRLQRTLADRCGVSEEPGLDFKETRAMIVDHRTYTFRPGTLAGWLKKYETEGLPIQKRHLGTFLGLYTTEIGNLHQTVMLWGYEDLADRERRRAAMAADPAWQNYMAEVHALEALQAQEIKILRPADCSPRWT
jgi:hypothetical protein